ADGREGKDIVPRETRHPEGRADRSAHFCKSLGGGLGWGNESRLQSRVRSGSWSGDVVRRTAQRTNGKHDFAGELALRGDGFADSLSPQDIFPRSPAGAH